MEHTKRRLDFYKRKYNELLQSGKKLSDLNKQEENIFHNLCEEIVYQTIAKQERNKYYRDTNFGI